jgi:hypothetical protein
MFNEVILLVHPTLGVLVILAGLWIFVDTLNLNSNNQRRIKFIAVLQAILMWLTFIVAGYWYVKYYPGDKALILAGPWPFVQNFFMETKEHLVIMLLLLCTYLPIVALNNDLLMNKKFRHLVLWLSAFIALLGLVMDGAGAMISMGVKVDLLSKVVA